MRKLALLLGSLVVVASASAKEVVPAPVVVEEAPVQIVEKEVIVYRDKEEGFRPNGYVDLQYRWYGDTEGQNEDYKGNKFADKAGYDSEGNKINVGDETPGNKNWNTKNNYSRIQLLGKINMTENQSLEYRVRTYDDLDKEDGRNSISGTDTRLRYFYNHGYLGDSKVNLTSRVHYRNYGHDDDSQELEYMARFNFAEYMFNSDFVKTTDFTVAPKYAYSWGDGNSSDYDNQIGADLYTMHELPLGFSFEFNVYATQHFYGQDQYFDGGKTKEDKNFTVDVEAYIYNTTNLYTNGNVSVDFNFEGGYDAYSWSQEKKFGTKKWDAENKGAAGTDDTKYSLYALPTVQLNYQATPNVKLYAAAGAEYRDWAVANGNSATNWRWQPTVFAGFKTTF